MKVIKWIGDDEITSDMKCSIGGLGGWFDAKEGHTWETFFDNIAEEENKKYVEALRDSIIQNNIRGGGDWHQDSPEGTPLFEDNTIASFSFRAWGDLLAAIWTKEDKKPYSYMDFYMTEGRDK